MAEIPESLCIAKTDHEIGIIPRMANRHGLIAGATGTGKTVTLRVMAEQLSSIGIPVFMADIKGDLTGMAMPGGEHPKVRERAAQLGMTDMNFEGLPVVFWDVFGQKGHPLRTTICEIGPLMLGRILNLNDIQSSLLTMIFKIADDSGLLLLDLKDLRSMVKFVGEQADQFKNEYGNISTASIGAIQRSLLDLEEQNGDLLFGEPALNLQDMMQTGSGGRGIVNILAADRLMQSPKLYATFLLWMLSELFEQLPEVGDPSRPVFVFFFDEAHLLFEDIPHALASKIEQVVRLIRSKGVGVYFITQNPLDIPEDVLGQLGNRVQHALRAFTPKEQKAVKAAAETFRTNPDLDVATVIMELGVGEALVSFLDLKGVPGMVERALICPPRSRLLPLTDAERNSVINSSVLAGHYERGIDRESAYEKLKEKTAQAAVVEDTQKPRREVASEGTKILQAMAQSAAHAIGSQVGRQIIRGVLGSIFGKAKR